MKRKSIGIKWNILAYFAIFVAILLALLWTFQIVFLDAFYQTVKKYTIQNSAEILGKNIESDTLQELIEQLSEQNELSIQVIRFYSEQGYTQQISSGENLTWSELLVYYNRAQKNGGTFFEIIKPEKTYQFHFSGLLSAISTEKMIYVALIPLTDGQEAMTILTSTITPVGATVYTLRIQLACLTIILLLLAGLLAVLLARRISSPIISLNEKARHLAIGNYSIDYTTNSYREISELGNTLNYASKELSTVDALRRELLANISHDLRTPLTMIIAYSEAMRDLPGENTPENIQIVIDEANRLSLLVNDITELSKLQSGAVPMVQVDFSLTDSLHTIMERLGTLVRPQGFQLVFEPQQTVTVHGDPKQLERVAYNLIQNALQHTGDDHTVTITQTISADTVTIAVTDSGSGISAEQLPHIWDRYYKLERTEHNRALGTGLGLSIVKAILEAHNAQFGVSSELGKGSTFWYTLPISKTQNF